MTSPITRTGTAWYSGLFSAGDWGKGGMVGCTSDRAPADDPRSPDFGFPATDSGTSQDSQTRPDTQAQPDLQTGDPMDKDHDGHKDIQYAGSWCTIYQQGMEITDKICDCDDTNFDIFPGSDEKCNGIDDNCDGQIDEDKFFYNPRPGQEDTVDKGECKIGILRCMDGNYEIYQDQVLPGTEFCDGLDNDCDGETDEDVAPVISYAGPEGTRDKGVCLPKIVECVNGEIKETQAEVLPQAEEICGNNLDDDCNGVVDDPAICNPLVCSDNDEDGYSVEGGECGLVDCNDNDLNINPTAAELCNNVDDNCNDQIDEEIPMEEICEVGAGACANRGNFVCGPNGLVICNAVALPASPEIPCNDIDEDCNGVVFQGTDNDGDGFKLEGGLCGPVDCDDRNLNVYPGANEICNGIDDNCNNQIDEGNVCIPPCVDNDQDGYGENCELGPDCDDDSPLINPAAQELCNYRDDNCDGQVDEGVNVGEPCTSGIGACLSQGRTICAPNGLITICDAPELLASNEVCDGIDNDCDNEIDEPEILCSCDPDGDGIITDHFRDPNLLAAIRVALGKGPEEEITREDALRTTSLNLPTSNIHDLSGLECFVNLTWLDISSNQITDLQPLTGLINITRLNLYNNKITDLQPLTGLINITRLYLYQNQISNLQPLAEMVNLTYLDIQENQISDLQPLGNLVNLITLDLSNNQITDLQPLSGLINLSGLDLNNNNISDLQSLPELVNLSGLSLSFNQIADIQPLGSLLNLRELDLSNNQISDLHSISGLVNLTGLGLSNNQIRDFQPLENLVNLTWLNLNSSQISNLQPLARLVNLTSLELIFNQIADINSLINNPGLAAGDMVRLENNPLIPPAQIAALRDKGVTVWWP